MTCDELQQRLDEAGIRRDVYQLGGGLPNERLCLVPEGDHWMVYYSEGGERTGLREFTDEDAANDYFFETLNRMPEARARGHGSRNLDRDEFEALFRSTLVRAIREGKSEQNVMPDRFVIEFHGAGHGGVV